MEGISYSTVCDYLSWRRPQIPAWARRTCRSSRPTGLGAEAEADFGDVWINLAGQMTKCFLFIFRMSYSGKAVHRSIDRTNGYFCADPGRGGRVVRHASTSWMTRPEGRWCTAR